MNYVVIIAPQPQRSIFRESRNLSPLTPYDDGAQTIFLYTKGTEGDPPKELRELLHYMENSTEENAINDSLKRIYQIVMFVKHDKEVTSSFMKIFEREEMLKQQGRREEQANTERERLRAERAEKEILFLKEQLAAERKKEN